MIYRYYALVDEFGLIDFMAANYDEAVKLVKDHSNGFDFHVFSLSQRYIPQHMNYQQYMALEGKLDGEELRSFDLQIKELSDQYILLNKSLLPYNFLDLIKQYSQYLSGWREEEAELSTQEYADNIISTALNIARYMVILLDSEIKDKQEDFKDITSEKDVL